MSALKRGLLIVLEGCDRTGKTTLAKRLVADLGDKGKSMRFPDRTTDLGKVIDRYLKGTESQEDHVIHLLFSANRWEKVGELESALKRGCHVVVDRYAFSGVAFSAAKEGLSLEWCKQPDSGLPGPDLVCFMDVSPEVAIKRGGFGDEVYERTDFQIRVRENYNHLMDSNWKTIDTDNKTLDDVYNELSSTVQEAISKHEGEPIKPLWPIEENNKAK